jgi:hypothetical protein
MIIYLQREHTKKIKWNEGEAKYSFCKNMFISRANAMR